VFGEAKLDKGDVGEFQNGCFVIAEDPVNVNTTQQITGAVPAGSVKNKKRRPNTGRSPTAQRAKSSSSPPSSIPYPRIPISRAQSEQSHWASGAFAKSPEPTQLPPPAPFFSTFSVCC